MRVFSAEVKSKDRAGRAPYNFVPLPERWRSVEAPPAGDRYHEGHLTGEIHVGLSALTPFYTRGMWSLAEYQAQPKEKQNPAPFQVDGRLRLPGSSIRGMIRNMVEILAGAPLDPINDTQLFFRSVAAVPEPENVTSFEPQAHEYKKRLLDDGELVVNAGYLYADWDAKAERVAWKIHPATEDAETGRQWYRYRTLERWILKEVRFDPDGDFANVSPGGAEQGWLVCSGPIPRKTKQWVVRTEDVAAEPLEISEQLVQAYKENGVTRDLKGKFEYSDRTRGLPCFYTTEGGKVTGFGHTAYFRMPYNHRPPDAIPAELRRDGRENEWDFAQALFGRVPKGNRPDGGRSRVFFEDGVYVSGASEPGPEIGVVLGQPKPTTYQHYLVQPSDRLDQMHHWDGDYRSKGDPVLRGHKLYWHRVGAPLTSADPQKDNVTSRIRPAPKGVVFSARIRFENLRPTELGALLVALILPKDCAHHLGMGKPLGLGSFRIDLRAVMIQDPAKRYSSFVSATRDGDALAHGLSVPSGEKLLGYQNEFASWYQEGLNLGRLWVSPRFKELRALLTCGEQQATERWWNMTRYLEFGSPQDFPGVTNYNEYTHVGYPLGRARLSKRRPLPKASQVLEGGGAIPDEPRPNFVTKNKR